MGACLGVVDFSVKVLRTDYKSVSVSCSTTCAVVRALRLTRGIPLVCLPTMLGPTHYRGDMGEHERTATAFLTNRTSNTVLKTQSAIKLLVCAVLPSHQNKVNDPSYGGQERRWATGRGERDSPLRAHSAMVAGFIPLLKYYTYPGQARVLLGVFLLLLVFFL